MSKVIHVTNKGESFSNAMVVLCEDNMSFSVTKLKPEQTKELVKGQHLTFDINLTNLRQDICDLVVDKIGSDLLISDLYEDELHRNSNDSDSDYHFDDIILFADVDYIGDEFTVNYYKIDILM